MRYKCRASTERRGLGLIDWMRRPSYRSNHHTNAAAMSPSVSTPAIEYVFSSFFLGMMLRFFRMLGISIMQDQGYIATVVLVLPSAVHPYVAAKTALGACALRGAYSGVACQSRMFNTMPFLSCKTSFLVPNPSQTQQSGTTDNTKNHEERRRGEKINTKHAKKMLEESDKQQSKEEGQDKTRHTPYINTTST